MPSESHAPERERTESFEKPSESHGGSAERHRKMLDENRYCGDVLTQVAAVEQALQSFAYRILQEHMETCVVEEIQKGNFAVVEEAVELMKKLK